MSLYTKITKSLIVFFFLTNSLLASDIIHVYFNRPSPIPVPGIAGDRHPAAVPSNQIPTNRCGRIIYNNLQTVRLRPVPKHVDILMYELNDDALLPSILTAARHGAEVRILIQRHKPGQPLKDTLRNLILGHNRTVDPPVEYRRIHIKILSGQGAYGIMHHKVVLTRINAWKDVIFGSFNMTNNASKYNYENCARIRHAYEAEADHPAIPMLEGVIDNYQAEFDALWEIAEEIGPDYAPIVAPVLPAVVAPLDE